MSVEEFDFFRKVKSHYYHVSFWLSFTYCFAHRHMKIATARGAFSCGVDVHTQTVVYTMQLKSDPIHRPRSQSDSFLFSTVYEAIPAQTIEFANYPILRLKYRVPIDYDWQQFIRNGAESAINKSTMSALFKKWELHDENGEPVDGKLKVVKVQFDG
ncbi:hypothetical protein D3P08_26400 [Paenibacillus nanensis]|uniref:Uncharacterized protein n=1 Tax=Paenibacillus nanensis TaxID=393251 RepID=A0A3A1UHK9_9BACL|nr:hypothetical protein [Paenibacillus nanensis]RIX46337.1 hypothetical protein D3P08_26400 [Paenibacillus nanensis]